jgi:serine/threonine protein kinase/protein involved in polysaccharide export with SLBB domain
MLLMTETCPNCGEELTSDNAAGGLCGRCLFERGIELTNTVGLAGGSTPGTHPFAAPDPVEVEADLLNFDVLELIGQGGMGAVYKAYQRSLDRTVAIKILPRQAAGGHEFAERFGREARALARLRHEHIVMAYDYGLTDRYLYSVMEYVGGPNLREYLRSHVAAASLLSPLGSDWERGETADDPGSHRDLTAPIPEGEGVRPLAPRQALEIARDICAALQYAHENGIVHRDIKPENILLDEFGRVKIADFGLAKLLQPDPRELALTHTRHFMGTLHYMAPEQSERPHETDHRADIYSLGVVLYEMLTSELPLGRFDPPSSRADVDPRVDEVVFRALEKDPARRYQTAAAFGDAITAALHDIAAPPNENPSLPRGDVGRGAEANATVDVSPSPSPVRRRSPRGPLVAAGFLGFLVAAFFGWQLLLKYQRDKDGNTTLTVEAKGGDEQPAKDGAASGPGPTPAKVSNARTESGAPRLKAFPLRHIKATELEELLRKVFGSDATRLTADDTGNRILAHADPKTMDKIEALLGRLDQPRAAADQSNGPGQADGRPADDKSALIGPVQIEFLDGLDQIVIRGDPRDVERTIESIKQLEAASKGKPEDLIRRLLDSGAKADETAVKKKSDQFVQVFQLKTVKASEITDLLRRVLGQDAGRFETDNRTNSIVVLADRETMSKIEALLKRLDRQETSSDQSSTRPSTSLSESENRVKAIQDEISQLGTEIERIEAELLELTNIAASGKETDEVRSRKFVKTNQLNFLQNKLSRAEQQLSSTTLERDRLRARIEAIDNGEYPEALLMGEIRSDPAMIDLRKQIDEARKLLQHASSVAKDPESNPAVQRAAALLKDLKEAETKLTVELREIAIAKLKWGASSSETKSDAKSDNGVRIQRDHSLRVSATGEFEEAPLDGLYSIDLDGYVNLGAEYGKFKVLGLTADEAQQSILDKLREFLSDPKVVLSIEGPDRAGERTTPAVPDDRKPSAPVKISREHAVRISASGTIPEAPLNGLYTIDVDGYVNLGAEYGKVKVAGLTADQAQEAILAKLGEVLAQPQVVLSIEAAAPRNPGEQKDAAKDQIKIFQLQNSKAVETAEMLRKLYPDAAIRISSDDVSNSVLVRGDRETLTEIEAILLRQDEATSSRSEKRDPPTRKADPQEQESRLRELRKQLEEVKSQLREQIPNAVETLETKQLKEEAARIEQQIAEQHLQGPRVTRLPPARVEPDHPWLVEMRKRLGNLNAAIAQLRFRQKGAEESPNLADFKREASSLQQQIWDFEAALLTARRHTTQPNNLPQMNTDKH